MRIKYYDCILKNSYCRARLLNLGLHSAWSIAGTVSEFSIKIRICCELKLDRPKAFVRPFSTNFSMAFQVSKGSMSSANRKWPSSSLGHIWSPSFCRAIKNVGLFEWVNRKIGNWIAYNEWSWPVNQIGIKVIQLEVRQGLPNGWFHIIRMVVSSP